MPPDRRSGGRSPNTQARIVYLWTVVTGEMQPEADLPATGLPLASTTWLFEVNGQGGRPVGCAGQRVV